MFYGLKFECVILCAIWYHLYNFKKVKNNEGGVLLLVKLQAEVCVNGTNLHKTYIVLKVVAMTIIVSATSNADDL